MNQFLARGVAVLNGIIAIVLIAAGAIGGAVFSNHLLGLIFGLFVALMTCGSVALIIEIHDELTKIRAALERSRRAA